MDIYNGPIPFGTPMNMVGVQPQPYPNYQMNIGIQPNYTGFNIPSTPIGGFYGNNTGMAFYNPYEYIRRQDNYLKQQASVCESQIDIRKRIIRSVARDNGEKIDEEKLDKQFENMRPQYKSYDDLYRAQSQQTYDNQEEISRIANIQTNDSITQATKDENFNNEMNKHKSRFEGKSFLDCCYELNEVAFELREDECKQARKNLKNSYNQTEYQKLISRVSNNNQSESIFGNTNIDDCEITLPSEMTDIITEKRKAFIASILAGK